MVRAQGRRPGAARNDLARKLGTVRAEHIISDYIVIRWWSDAMHGAAKALMEMRQFLGWADRAVARHRRGFRRAKRGKLEKELADVVKESKSQFGDPWGILALDAASRRVAQAQVTIVAPRLTAIYTERILPAERVAPAIAARAAADNPLVSQRAAKRPFTPEERELMRRHAINLPAGRLLDRRRVPDRRG